MIIYATIALMWVLSIGVSITMMYLVNKISHIEQDTVTREEFDIEHRRTAERINQIRDNVKRKKKERKERNERKKQWLNMIKR